MHFLGIPTQATLKPYQHESPNFNDTSTLVSEESRFSDDDNLEVLKRLYNPYFGRIKVIYTAPPYNTRKDFVYPDNYAAPLEPSLQLPGQKDSKGNRQTRDGAQSFLKGGASC